jgi:hypothetical protein
MTIPLTRQKENIQQVEKGITEALEEKLNQRMIINLSILKILTRCLLSSSISGA